MKTSLLPSDELWSCCPFVTLAAGKFFLDGNQRLAVGRLMAGRGGGPPIIFIAHVISGRGQYVAAGWGGRALGYLIGGRRDCFATGGGGLGR